MASGVRAITIEGHSAFHCTSACNDNVEPCGQATSRLQPPKDASIKTVMSQIARIYSERRSKLELVSVRGCPNLTWETRWLLGTQARQRREWTGHSLTAHFRWYSSHARACRLGKCGVEWLPRNRQSGRSPHTARRLELIGGARSTTSRIRFVLLEATRLVAQRQWLIV